MIFNKSHVLVNQKFKTKLELFTKLAHLACEKEIANNVNEVIKGFVDREALGSTGFEDGFAIPHAKIAGIKTPSIFVIRNNIKFSDWETIDNHGVYYVIALFVPLDANEFHIDILSKIASQMIDSKFRNLIKNSNRITIFNQFQAILKTQEEQTSKITLGQIKNIVGISSCPAGVAHTYMAKQKMEDACRILGYNVKWETQGANGNKNILNAEDVKEADVVIVASDVPINLDRFKGARVLVTSTNDAIRNGTKLIERSFEEASIFTGQNASSLKELWVNFSHKIKQSVASSFGASWMFLTYAGVMIAIFSLLGFALYGQQWTSNAKNLNLPLFQIQEIAKFALYLAMPVAVGSIALKATNKKEAFAIAFLGSFLLNVPNISSAWNTITDGQIISSNIFYQWHNELLKTKAIIGSNIIGSIIVLFTTIGMVNLVYYWKDKINNSQSSLSKVVKYGSTPWLTHLLPVLVVLVGVVFLLGAPLSFISYYLIFAFIQYSQNYWWLRFLIGGILGVLMIYDLGGLLNKILIILLIGLAQYDLKFGAIIYIAIPLPSIGFGLTYFIFKSRFKNEDLQDAATSFKKGLKGISEGPLFQMHKYGLRVLLPNILSTFLATGMAFALGIYVFNAGHISTLFFGAQADLSHANDLNFLNNLLPRNAGFLTIITSLVYGIISYYFIMVFSSLIYVLIAGLTFSFPGAKQVFKSNLEQKMV